MSAKLYGVSVSHPSHAAQAMLRYKGIEHEVVNFPSTTQPVAMRLLGFRGRTVPGLKIDGRKVQGTLRISRALDEIKPDPPLFPQDRRAAVEEAETWGERELQPLPRRFFRWGLAYRPELRRWAMEISKAPAPGVVAQLTVPTMRYFARLSRATDAYTREGVERLPELLDRVDELIADGTIGRAEAPNAADFQIGSTIAVLRVFSDIRDALAGRPGLELAERLFPKTKELPEVPAFLPAEWLTALRRG